MRPRFRTAVVRGDVRGVREVRGVAIRALPLIQRDRCRVLVRARRLERLGLLLRSRAPLARLRVEPREPKTEHRADSRFDSRSVIELREPDVAATALAAWHLVRARRNEPPLAPPSSPWLRRWES